MSKRLTGLNPLAYMGVEPLSPAQTYNQMTDPTTNDFIGFNLGDVWINKSGVRAWIYLGRSDQGEAQWLELADASSAGASSFITDSGTATTTISGQITVAGGSNINTSGTANTVTVNLDNNVTISGNYTTTTGNINLPNTNSSSTQGVITFNSIPFISNFGTGNTFVGENAGTPTAITTASQNSGFGQGALTNLTSGVENCGFGLQALEDTTTGSFNSAFGDSALAQNTTGTKNTAIGALVMQNISTGTQNTALGYGSGQAYAAAESNNILISHNGVLSENNTIHIGTQGSSAGQQNRCFIAGIRGVTTGNNDAVAVLVDSAGQLGTVSSSRIHKENIQDMRAQSDSLMSLRPVTFNYIRDMRKLREFGLIAEEVAEIMPELVVYTGTGQPETVRYHVLVPMLLNEIQKLEKRVKALESPCHYRR